MKIGRFSCPDCRQVIETDLGSLGKSLACPNCRLIFFPDFKIFDDETGLPATLTQSEQIEIYISALKSGAIKYRVKIVKEK